MPGSAELETLVAAIVSTAAFSSVCSANWMPATEIAKPLPRRIERSLTASSMPSAAGPSSAASAGRRGAVLTRRTAREGRRHDHQRDERCGGDPHRDRRLAVRDADGCRDRERDPRSGFHKNQAPVQREVLVAGQPAAGEVAGGVGDDPDDEDPVQRGRVEHVVRELVVERQRDRQEDEREGALDRHRDAHRQARDAAGAVVGDRAREQLLDRPVDHADDHEHHRPQDVQVRVLRRGLAVVVEQVRGEREVGERQDAGRGDPDREHPRAARVGGGCAGGPGSGAFRLGQAPSSRGTASASRSPRRGGRRARRSPTWRSG